MNTTMFVAASVLVVVIFSLVFWKKLPKVPKPKTRVCPLDSTQLKTHYYAFDSHGNNCVAVKFPLLFQIKTKVNNPKGLTLHHTQICPACSFDIQVHVPDEVSRQAYIEHCREYRLNHTPS